MHDAGTLAVIAHPAARHAPHDRVAALDLLRAAACLMVVAFHYLAQGQTAGWLRDAPPAGWSAVARHGHLGVPLFFMISGFVVFMSAEGTSLRAFAASRLARLGPALWVAAPLTALAGLAAHDAAQQRAFQVTPGQLLGNLTLLPAWFDVPFVDGVYWTLAVELQFYLLVALALAARRLERIEPWLWSWLLLALLNAARPIWPLQFWLAARWAPFFVAGIVCHLIRRRGTTVQRWSLLAAAHGLGLAAMARQLSESATTRPGDLLVAHVAVTVYLMLFLLIALRRWALRGAGWITLCGALTYPVYLLHQNIGIVLISQPAWAGCPLLLRAAAVTLAIGMLAWAVHAGVERPLAPRLRRWLEGRSPLPRPATSLRP